MTNRVIHQKYLEAWLRGESVQFCILSEEGWWDFDVHHIERVNDESCKFRITPKTVEVNLTDFYAEYHSITYTTDTLEFGIALTDLFNKYLPRESK